MSAQASDMSGWLLMGLPGTAFLLTANNGMADAFWTAAGLALGTYINWLVLAKRLRKFSEYSGDAITLPTYLENRFKDNSQIIKLISAIFIVIFFLIYTAAQFSAGAKLFNAVFGLDYIPALIIGAVVIVSYTFLGGYLAVCWTDLFQGILMFFAVIAIPIIVINKLGGNKATFDIVANLANLPNKFSFNDLIGTKGLGGLAIISAFAWGLGYFGQPHILSRFMGIRHSDDIKPARRIAMVWVIFSLSAAVVLGIVGKAYMSTVVDSQTLADMDGEKIFIYLVQNILKGPVLAILAGILLTAILAAIMSTADSQLLVTSSAISEDIFKSFNKKLTTKQLMWISRGSVLIVALIAIIIAANPDSSVFDLVAYAWAGIISGGLSVIIWRSFIKSHFNLYELLPAFIVSSIFIILVSFLTSKPSKDILDEFDAFLDADI